MFKKLLLFVAFFSLCISGFAQTITSLTPSTALQGQYLNVTIVGQGTNFTSGVSSVKLIYGAGSGTYYTAASHTIVSDTELAVDFSIYGSAPAGFYRLEIYNNGNLISHLNAFEVIANTTSISSVSPNSSQRNNTLTISVVGVNTSFQSGGVSIMALHCESASATTYIGSNIQVTSETQASASFTLPNDAPLGSYYLEMYTNNHMLIESNAFTVVDPNAKEISSISPSSSGRNQSLTVSLVGLNTSFQSGGVSSVKLHLMVGSQTFEYYGTNISVTDDTHFSSNFSIPADAPLNYYDVVVASNNEEITKLSSFNVTAQNDPSISSVSPNSSELNKTLTVTVVGFNTSFQTDGVGSVQLIYATGSPTTYYMGSSITINSETELTVDFTIPANAPLGYYTMELVSNNKTLSKYHAFEVYNPNPPSINSVSPATSERNKTLDVTVVGVNSSFQSGVSSFKLVYSNGSPTTYVGSNIVVNSNTSATASFSIPANAPLGYYTVEINNNGTILTKNSSFLVTVPVQSIKSVSKTTAAKEETFVLSVIGNNTTFTSGVSAIGYSMENAYLLNNPTSFNGTNITVINDTSLTVEFTVPADAFLGDYKLTLTGNINLNKNNALQIESPGNDVSGTFDDLVEGDIIYLIDINNDTVATDTLNANLYFEFLQVANGQYEIIVQGLANGSIPLMVSDGDQNTLALTSNGGNVLGYVTGVKEVVERKSFLVYPNPAVSVLNIEVPSLTGNVEIYNSIGERLMSVSLNSMADNKIAINVSELNSGMYFVNYMNGMSPITATFLVVR